MVCHLFYIMKYLLKYKCKDYEKINYCKLKATILG